MTWWQVLIVAEGAIFLVFAWSSLGGGYRRRRPYWTRGSWLRFGAVCLLGILLSAAPLATELAISRGLFSRQGLTADARSLWALATLAAMLLGALLVVGSIAWFARGDPTRQFPGAVPRRQ